MSLPKISAFVICYNRADTIGTCLRALRFADELIVVDKSSYDNPSYGFGVTIRPCSG